MRDKGQTGEGAKENRRKKIKDLNITAFEEVLLFIRGEKWAEDKREDWSRQGSFTDDGGGIFFKMDEKRVLMRIIQ